MADQSAFDRKKIATEAYTETSDLLDQLNLPPALTTFLRKNKQIIWIVVILVTVVVTVTSLYGSYRTYRITKATSALDAAIMVDGEQRFQQLQSVIDTYASTPSGVWARIELAHAARKDGDMARATGVIEKLNTDISAKEPLKPLVLFYLAGLYEQQEKLEQAILAYKELAGQEGFAAEANRDLGRVYEAQGEKELALEAYRQYLSLNTEEGVTLQADPARQVIQDRVNRLAR